MMPDDAYKDYVKKVLAKARAVQGQIDQVRMQTQCPGCGLVDLKDAIIVRSTDRHFLWHAVLPDIVAVVCPGSGTETGLELHWKIELIQVLPVKTGNAEGENVGGEDEG